jgi:protein tyrosine/serine phosphatase
MHLKSRVVCAYTVAVLVALVPAFPASLHASEAARSSSAISLSQIRIGNFGRVNVNYYRGEQPEGRDYNDLAALGIRTVIDLQADGNNQDEAQRVETAGMTFYRIPMTTRVPPTPEQITRFLDIVTDPARQPVYVHCAGGKHRTGVMTAVYRIEQNGWTADQAFQEMKQYRFGPSLLHPGLKKFVYAYRPLRTARPDSIVPVVNTTHAD